MATIITAGATTITADAVDGYESSRESGNRVHAIPGRPGPDASLRVAGLRTGTIRLAFASEVEADAAENTHAMARSFTLLSEDRPTVNMTYILQEGGRISRTLEAAGYWTVSVDFQEVTA